MSATSAADAPPAPIAASAAACSRRATRTGSVDDRAAIRDHPANFGRLCSKGSALGETLSARRPAAAPDRRRRRDELGRGARPRRRDGFAETIAEHGPDCGRLLCLRPAPDRGLLRRQQADEGLHRLRQYRHQFAALHGLVGRRPQARLRRGHRARHATRISKQADLVVLVGSNLAWCHPVLYQRLDGGAREARRHADRRRSTRAAPRPPRSPICICRSRRAPTSRCSTACSRISPSAGAIDRRLRRRAYDRASTRRSPRRAALDRRRESPQRPGSRRERARAPSTTCSPAPSASSPSIQPGRQPVVRRHRQGQRDHQLPSRDRPHRPARHGAVLGHRPAERHGRARGRRPRQHARRPYGVRESRASRASSSASGARRRSPTSRASRRSTCSTPSPTAASRRSGSWPPIRPISMPDADRVRAALAACPFVVVSDVLRADRHDRARRTCCCRRRPGARRTARSPIPSAASRASARFLPAPGEARPDWWIVCEVAQRMGFGRGLRLSRRRRDLPRARRALRRSRTTARATSTSAPRRHRRTRTTTRSRPSNGRGRGAPARGRDALLRRRRLLSRRPQGALRRDAVPRAGRRAPTPAYPAGPQHRPRPRPVAHHDPHRQKRRACRSISPSPSPRSIPRTRGAFGIADADIVRVSSARGSVLVRALLIGAPAPGTIFVPMHWTDQFAGNARIDRARTRHDRSAFRPAGIEARAGRVERFAAARHGFAVLREPAIRARRPTIGRLPSAQSGWRLELAFAEDDRDWTAFAASLFAAGPRAETLVLSRRGDRPASLRLFRRRAPGRSARSRLGTCRRAAQLGLRASRRSNMRGNAPASAVIAGRPGLGLVDRGAIVCSCFGVGANEIATAMAAGLPERSARSARRSGPAPIAAPAAARSARS